MESVTVIIPLGFWDVLPKLERWTSRSPGAFQWDRISPPKKRWDTFHPGSGWGCILSKAQMILTPFVRHATWYLGWSNRKNPQEFSVKKQRCPRFPWFCSQLPESAFRFYMVFYTFWLGHIFEVKMDTSFFVLWAVGSLELGSLRGNPSPPKFNIIDAKNLDFFKNVSPFKYGYFGYPC